MCEHYRFFFFIFHTICSVHPLSALKNSAWLKFHLGLDLYLMQCLYFYHLRVQQLRILYTYKMLYTIQTVEFSFVVVGCLNFHHIHMCLVYTVVLFVEPKTA